MNYFLFPIQQNCFYRIQYLVFVSLSTKNIPIIVDSKRRAFLFILAFNIHRINILTKCAEDVAELNVKQDFILPMLILHGLYKIEIHALHSSSTIKAY